jgi:hypothetical protein
MPSTAIMSQSPKPAFAFRERADIWRRATDHNHENERGYKLMQKAVMKRV